MPLSTESLVTLAHFTRRWHPRENPALYAVGRFLLRKLCHRRNHRPTGLVVMPYDRGLFRCNLSDKLGYHVMFHGYHDVALARLLRAIVKPGDVCMDLGANVGAYTLVMAFAAGPAGRVIAVEPNPTVAAELRANVSLNALMNVDLIQAAVAPHDGEMPFFLPDDRADNLMTSSASQTSRARREATVKAVSGRTLEAALKGAALRAAKIDCIGSEVTVLEQLAGVIERDKPYLFIDYRLRAWRLFGRRPEEAVDMLRSLGYDVYVAREGVVLPLDGAPVPDKCNIVGVPSYAPPVAAV
jgi:FkbM family methyltransferase